MPFKFSTAARDAAANVIETTIGASPTLELRNGTEPANCAAARTGTVLATLLLPANWMGDSVAGAKALLGTWADTSADAAGTATQFCIMQGATCHIQGSVGATGSGADLTLDNPVLAAGQQVSVSAFSITLGGA